MASFGLVRGLITREGRGDGGRGANGTRREEEEGEKEEESANEGSFFFLMLRSLFSSFTMAAVSEGQESANEGKFFFFFDASFVI